MKRISRHWRSGVLACLAICLVWGAAAAQNFTESTQVVVVEVPVQVVRDGEPVKGLTAESFEVFDGRKKMPITGFEVLDLTTTTTAAASQAGGQEPPPASARRHFLVLFDLSFSDPKGIFQARKAAQDMVKVLHPTDLVGVATYSNKGPQIALGFTSDRRQIAAAIESLGLPELADRTPDPLRLLVTDVQAGQAAIQGQKETKDPKASSEAAVLENMEKLYSESRRADAEEQKAKIAGFTQAISALARMMDAVDGRKYVIYLSEGFDTSLVQGSQNQEEQMEQADNAAAGALQDVSSDQRFGDTKTLNQVEKMLEEFRRADCIVQAVDIGGLRASGAVEGNSRGRGGKDSLLQIAKGTGGELFENTNNLAGAMQEVLKRTSVTYVLAFQPDALKWDGNYHRIKVELKGQPRGTRLVHRPGYYAPKPYNAQHPMEKMMDAASQLTSGEESGNVKMSVLAAPFQVAGDKAYVPVVLEVDGPSLLANTQGTALPAEVYIYAMDSGGAVHDFVAQTLGLDVTKAGAQLRQSGLKFFGHVDLYPGDYTIRVMVRNGATGNLALRVVPVRVPAFAEAGPFLLPPFFPETGTKWLMAREAPREGTAQNVPYPFMQDQQPYIPASKPVLTPGQDAPLSLVAYNLGSGDVKAQAKVLSADGKEMGTGDLKLLGSESGSPSRLKASFKPPALQPGEYRLQVTLMDPSGTTHSSSTAFTVGGASKATR